MDPINTPFEYSGHMVPGIWRYLLPKEAQEYRLPKERRATCDNCPMSCFHGYDKTHRCCAYHPLMPNFLIGLALKQKSSRPFVENLLKQGNLTPNGYERTPHQWVDYLADLSEDVAERVRCPLLNTKNGLCTVYPFRNAVCSTFFCLNDHGEAGHEFWENLEEMVSHMEVVLGQWALEKAGFDVRRYFKMLDRWSKKIETVSDPKTGGWAKWALKEMWGPFYGKELELLEKTAEIVSENRDKLWEIAEKRKILESKKFDKAMVHMVPEEYHDEIDPADLEDEDDGVETAGLDECWKDVRKAYKKMWKHPKKLVLSPRAEIAKNKQKDEESKAFGHMPYVVQYLKKKGGKTWEWREFVTEETAEALKKFRRPRNAEKSGEKFLTFTEPGQFLSEWHGKKILRRPST